MYIPLRLRHKGALLALTAESKQLLVVLRTDTKKKAFYALLSMDHVPRAGLLCSCKDTTSGTLAEISHYLVKFGIVSHHCPRSVCSLRRQNGTVKVRCVGNITPASFKSW